MNPAGLAVLLALIPTAAHAVDPDECEQQRAQYPAIWNDVSKERALFTCSSHYSGSVQITLGPANEDGRRVLSVVPLKGNGPGAQQDPSTDVYRLWLDREQAHRLLKGKYFATVLRRESSCWIRGGLDTEDGKQTPVLFMDNANPPPDGVRRGAGSFYNKAPRFSVFLSNAYYCKLDH
jgi:hypothetical protein